MWSGPESVTPEVAEPEKPEQDGAGSALGIKAIPKTSGETEYIVSSTYFPRWSASSNIRLSL